MSSIRKKRLLEAAAWSCERCGNQTTLELHHRDRNPSNNELSNLEILCRPCHASEHQGGRRMSERHRRGGNYLPEDYQTKRRRALGVPKARAHRLNVRVDEDTLSALRSEAHASGWPLSGVMREAIRRGLPRVEAARLERTVEARR